METFSDWSRLPAEIKAHFDVLEDFIGGLDGQETYGDDSGTIDASDAVKATNAIAAELIRLHALLTETRQKPTTENERLSALWIAETRENERLHGTLTRIAMQLKTDELEEPENADFEGGYDAIIEDAREAVGK